MESNTDDERRGFGREDVKKVCPFVLETTIENGMAEAGERATQNGRHWDRGWKEQQKNRKERSGSRMRCQLSISIDRGYN